MTLSIPGRLTTAATALGACALAVGTVAGPASAADFPPQYESAQRGLTYAVYAPANPQGLDLTNFKLIQCGPKEYGWDEQIVATYGRIKGKHIQMFESHRPCEDGPWPMALVKKFKIGGATARLYAGCDTPASCQDATTANVKSEGGWVSVTLNGVPVSDGSPGLSSTYIDIYSENVTATKLTNFAKSLQIPS